jgi:prepilin-type N-terminal cleavage/methylation domain-containing protein
MASTLLDVVPDSTNTENTVARFQARVSGFTILELLMVMAIIAIISAVALPKLDFSRYRIDAGVRGLAAGLQRAQRMAVTNQSNVNVVFVTAQSAIRIHEDENNNNVMDPNERVRQYPLGEGVEFGLGPTPTRLYTPAPITFTRQLGGLPELIFRRDGSASENGAIYITSINATARNRTQDARSVELIEATGRIEWWRYTGAAWQRKF